MNPLDIIHAYYRPESELARILVRHSERVRDKALSIARRVPHLTPDLHFIDEAAMLHDIGIFGTRAAKIQCNGSQPYICHGVIGRQILEQRGLQDHALVCERHVGAGISRQEIQSRSLPLPPRDMLPISTEEMIICYADKFFSKTNGGKEHSIEDVIAGVRRYGLPQKNRFLTWHKRFSV